jgi:hypothetical protein
MKIRKYKDIDKNYEVKKSKIDPIEDDTSQRFDDLRFNPNLRFMTRVRSVQVKAHRNIGPR